MHGNNIDDFPLVSIIMNCYNGQKYLKEAIDSVISQTYSNWQLIFWDNQSTDESEIIVKSYNDDRICYYLAENRTPLSKARNLAIQRAEGEYLAFLDTDDVWLPKKLEMQMIGFQQEKNVGISYCGFDILLTSDSKNAIIQSKFYSKFKYKSHNSKSIYNKLLRGNFIIFSTVILKRDIFDLTNGFSENLDQNEDFEILLKVSMYSNAICVGNNLVKYRIHSSNNSYQNARKNFIESEYIFSNLPKSSYLKLAIDRNITRKKIYFIFYEKKWSALIYLLHPKYWLHLFYLFYKKIVK
jgi:glycosyltransferase involved in cell wall biosynthesis